MVSQKTAERPLAVYVPSPQDDRPSWLKVGGVAVVGFVVGIAWPRLLGIRLGPSAPAEAASARTLEPAASVGPVSPASAAAASAAPPAPPPPAAPLPDVAVSRGVVLSCKTADGDTLKGAAACGSLPGFDPVAKPRLTKLGACGAAASASGKLSAVFSLDFKTNRVAVEVGRSSTVQSADGIAACMKTAFQGVSLGPIDHQQLKYAVLYSVMFTPPKAATEAASGPTGAIAPAPAPTSGSTDADSAAQVVWEVALVRDAPRTGQVVARLPRGTKVHLGAGDDGWYRIQYGAGASSLGWVYRGAVGR